MSESKPLVEMKKFTLKFSSYLILDEVDLTVHQDDFITLLGHNGCGKSSLLKCLAGEYFATGGKIQYHILPHKDIVYLNQKVEDLLFPCLSVFENCMMWKTRLAGKLYQMPSDAEKQFFCDYLQTYNPKLASLIDEPVGRLSGGEQQVLLLALIMLQPPKLLLLDEHTSALDPAMSSKILHLTLELVKKHSIAVVMTTHNLKQLAELPGKVFVLKNHKFAERFCEEKPTMEALLEYY